MIQPDFIIIGAMKCGTSTLAAQLGAQEGVFMTTPKEPNFFSDEAVFARGHAWYEELFKAANAADLKGEASTHYTKLPTYPETLSRLQATGAQPKLIYMLRDPIDRLISHYIHEWTQGIITTSLEDAITAHPELRSYSRYGEQLAPWVEAFGAKNILVLSMQGLKTDPQELLQAAGAFLGKADVTWTDDLGQMNVSAERIRKLPLHGLIFDNPVAEWVRRTLVPQALRDFIKSKRQMQIRPDLSADIRAQLVVEFSDDRDRLLALFPERPELADIYPKSRA